MTRPPLHAILLTAAGLVPFVWGAAFAALGTTPDLPAPDGMPLFSGSDPREWLRGYGTVILSFMTGVLWGFAARAGAGPLPYALSTLPALWAFFNWGPPDAQLSHLAFGFLGLLILDGRFQRQGFAPAWWMTLRIPVTLAVCACLWTGAATA